MSFEFFVARRYLFSHRKQAFIYVISLMSIIGVALLIALNYMVINTVVDILYGIIDPRVRCS